MESNPDTLINPKFSIATYLDSKKLNAVVADIPWDSAPLVVIEPSNVAVIATPLENTDINVSRKEVTEVIKTNSDA
jgi:hypothetical protein